MKRQYMSQPRELRYDRKPSTSELYGKLRRRERLALIEALRDLQPIVNGWRSERNGVSRG